MTKIAKDNRNLIIGVLVIALIAVLFLGTFTGQAFWNQPTITDKTLSSAQKVAVLNLLSNCEPIPLVFYEDIMVTGNDLCKTHYDPTSINYDPTSITHYDPTSITHYDPTSICIFVLHKVGGMNEIIDNCENKFTAIGDGKTYITPLCCKP